MRTPAAGWALLLLGFGVFAGAASEPGSGNSEPLDPRQLVPALQKGGYVWFMRHPATNPDQADTDTMNLDNLKAQRHLSEEGRAQAKGFGEAIRKLKIPIGRVVASKYYRAIETAKLADLGEVATSLELTDGQNISPNEWKKRIAGLKQTLSTPPPAGTNVLLVSHRPNLQSAAGKEFGDLAEGEIAVFQPLEAKGFHCVRRVKIEEWSGWLKPIDAGRH